MSGADRGLGKLAFAGWAFRVTLRFCLCQQSIEDDPFAFFYVAGGGNPEIGDTMLLRIRLDAGLLGES